MNNDLISREALKSELELSKYIVPNSVNKLLNSEIDRCIEAVENAPAVDATVNTVEVRPQGKWIDHSLENLLWGQNECPFCHKRSNSDASYCQYCGARMENSEE